MKIIKVYFRLQVFKLQRFFADPVHKAAIVYALIAVLAPFTVLDLKFVPNTEVFERWVSLMGMIYLCGMFNGLVTLYLEEVISLSMIILHFVAIAVFWVLWQVSGGYESLWMNFIRIGLLAVVIPAVRSLLWLIFFRNRVR